MAALCPMPPVSLPAAEMLRLGRRWLGGSSFDKKTGMEFGAVIDEAVGVALAAMLGGVQIVKPAKHELQPAHADCVEVGPVRIVGGVRPQDFDAGYRPDGARIAFDSKTLNDQSSVGKNWRNMINDLATEATTVHVRFPSAVLAFIVAIPVQCLSPGPQTNAIIGTLTRLGGRRLIDEPAHRAEAMALVGWNPETGEVDPRLPAADSPLRLETFSAHVQRAYWDRFQGLPPHAS